LMKRWCVQDKIPLADMDDGEKLHMSEWATKCVTNALFRAIEQKLAAAGA
jgi:acyl-CoA thioesterase I